MKHGLGELREEPSHVNGKSERLKHSRRERMGNASGVARSERTTINGLARNERSEATKLTNGNVQRFNAVSHVVISEETDFVVSRLSALITSRI